MRIVRQKVEPSRDDAVRMNRHEKLSMIVLAYVATVIDELQTDLKTRLGMIRQGEDRMHLLSTGVDELLNDLRLTVPMNQRVHLENTAADFEMRLAPKLTPSKTSIVMQKEEFKSLVDAARVKCRECTDDDEQCEKCELFQLLTVVLPLDDYKGQMLCPYNLGEWKD